MFTNPSIQSTITEFNRWSYDFHGFGMFSASNKTNYYVTQNSYTGGVVNILDDEWKFISYKKFSDPRYMITIGNSLYMTGRKNVWKVDQDLNILINYEAVGYDGDYNGISYNLSYGLIYVAAELWARRFKYSIWI